MLPPTTLRQLEAMLTYKKSQTLYVVLTKDSRGTPTLLVDIGTDQPYHNENKKVADFMATKCNGEARTWADAWAILNKAHPNLERDLVKRAEEAARKLSNGNVL